MLKDEYAQLYRNVLSDLQLAQDGYFEQDSIAALLYQRKRGKADHGNRLWLFINSEVWYRMHIKQHRIADVFDQINADSPKPDGAAAT